jgi:hypothetical protein
VKKSRRNNSESERETDKKAGQLPFSKLALKINRSLFYIVR